MRENARISRKIAEILELPREAIEEGVRHLQPFRFQKVTIGQCLFVLDVGHNPMALNRVLSDAKQRFVGKSLRVLLGMSMGRSAEEFVRVAFEFSEYVHMISNDHIRIVKFGELVEAAEKIGQRTQHSGEVLEVLQELVRRDSPNEVVVVIGSCFLMESVTNAFRSFGLEIGDNLADASDVA